MKRIVSKATRKRMSDAAKKRCTPEWRAATSERLSTPLRSDTVRGLYEVGLTQNEVGKQLGVSQKVIWHFMKRHGMEARIAKKRNQYGEKNSSWKGPNAAYQAMHCRLISRFGQPQRCDKCGTTDARRSYDWANMTGHFDNVADYRRLCRSCHCKRDGTVRNIHKHKEPCR